MIPSKAKTGFTLIEMSIVIVVIGLVIGGILVGRTLIRDAELKTIVSDWQRFEAARITFRNKYNCLPGDCSFASSLGLGANGNGNGYVEHVNTNVETWQFWKHLGDAQLISGKYTGYTGPNGSTDSIIDTNIPASKIPNVGYAIYTPYPGYTTWTGGYDTVGGKTRNITDSAYATGKQYSGLLPLGGFVTSREAYSIDIKYDDGLANNGAIRSRVSDATYNTAGCTSGSAPNYNYSMSDSNFCNMFYWFKNL